MNDIEKQIESALLREPEFRLPVSFADRMVSMMEASIQKEKRWEIFLIGLGALSFLAAFVVTIVLTDFKISLSGFPFIASHWGLAAFAVSFILLLNYLDWRLVRKVQNG